MVPSVPARARRRVRREVTPRSPARGPAVMNPAPITGAIEDRDAAAPGDRREDPGVGRGRGPDPKAGHRVPVAVLSCGRRRGRGQTYDGERHHRELTCDESHGAPSCFRDNVCRRAAARPGHLPPIEGGEGEPTSNRRSRRTRPLTFASVDARTSETRHRSCERPHPGVTHTNGNSYTLGPRHCEGCGEDAGDVDADLRARGGEADEGAARGRGEAPLPAQFLQRLGQSVRAPVGADDRSDQDPCPEPGAHASITMRPSRLPVGRTQDRLPDRRDRLRMLRAPPTSFTSPNPRV